jgi:hypothetical protein
MKETQRSARFARVLPLVALSIALAHVVPAYGKPVASTNGGSLSLTTDCGAAPPSPGQLFNLVGTITNTGSVAVTNISLVYVVSGTNAPVTPAAIPLLEPGQGTNLSGSYFVPPDLCAVLSEVRASGKDVSGTMLIASVSLVCPVATMPALALGLGCPTFTEAGMPLIVTGVITNVGDTTLTNVVILSQRPSPTIVTVIPRMEPGLVVPFSFSMPTMTNDCAITNIVAAVGSTPCGELVTVTATLTCLLLGHVSVFIQVIQSIVPEGVRADIFAYATGTPPFNFAWNLDGIVVTNTMGDSPGLITVFFDPTNETVHAVTVNVRGQCQGVLGLNLFTTIGAINLSRGFPSVRTGTNGSGAGPTESISCGALDSASKWFKMTANDTGLATVSTEGSDYDTILAVFIGPISSPSDLQLIQCNNNISPSNKDSRLQFMATPATYWLVVGGNASGRTLKLTYGFEPRIQLDRISSDGSVELRSTIAPALSYRVQASADLQSNSWVTLLRTNLVPTNNVITVRDTNGVTFGKRFYRIVPGS